MKCWIFLRIRHTGRTILETAEQTLRRGPDGEHGNGGLDWERQKGGQRVVDRLMAAAEVLGREIQAS